MHFSKLAFSAVVMGIVLGIVTAAPTEVIWCVPYDQPPSYAGLCTKALAAANTDDVTFSCVVGGTPTECMRMIGEGSAHLTTFDGGDLLTANTQQGFVPIVFENYGEGVGTSYYAVAAVRKEFCEGDVGFESLKGARSCHTGYRKTAGWYSPLGRLLSKGLLENTSEDPKIEDDAESIASFFSRVCAPRTSGNGPARGPDGVGQKWEKLCSGCAGDCSIHDKYYDYQGAFRCLMEDAGDVAFIKHSTIPDFALGGKDAEGWATEGPDNFMLLCPSGGCVPVDDYASCYLARTAAHSVVAPGDFGPGGEKEDLGKMIQDALVAASGKEGFLAGTVQLGDQKNFLFKKGTEGLDAVTVPFKEAVDPTQVTIYNAVQEFTEDGDR